MVDLVPVDPLSVAVDAQSAQYALQTVARDVEGRSQSKVEQRYQAAAEASRDGLVFFSVARDAHGAICDFEIFDLNQRAADLFANGRERMLGRTLTDLMPDAIGSGHFSRMVQVCETGMPHQETVPGEPLGVAAKWIRWQTVAIAEGLAVSICDVSHERALAAQLAQASRLESVGSLALGIAHDFNNMLSAILGFGGLALDAQPKDSKARGDIEQALKAAARAAQLTRYLLAFASRQELEPKAVDASRIIGDLAPILSRLAGESVSVTFDFDSTQVVWIDPCQFEQAIVNLVVNARDAMPHGGTILVTSRDVESPLDDGAITEHMASGRYLCVSVVDTGFGMDEATRSHIFEPFFTTKRPHAGSGLGLASVYGFVRQSNGHIRVESEVGRGTAIRMYFPPSKASVSRSSLPPPRLSGAYAKHRGRILLFEPDDSVRSVARRILAESGFEVTEANSVAAAEECLHRAAQGIDVLLTAVGLPHTVGIELAQRTKNHSPATSIVLLSGAADMRVIEKACADLGAQFVQKPFSAVALLGRVQEAMRLARAATAEFDLRVEG